MTMLIFLVALFAFLLMGIPIALGIMLTIAILIEVTGITSFAIIPTYFYAGLNNFSLMAIPFFILAGDLMNEGDLSRGLIEFCRKLLGHIKAGLGYAAVLACMMFACVSGAAVATVSAIGGIMLPLLREEGYDPADSTAVVCAGSITGPIIPPSIPFVVFGSISGASVTKIFMGGVIPGIIGGALVMITWYLMTRKKDYPVLPKASAKEVLIASKKALPSIMMPVIMMGGMLVGIFTPTEAGVIAVVYAYIIARFVNKKMSMKTLRKVLIGSAKSSAVIMFIVASTNALGILITVLQVPQMVAEVLMAISSNPLIIMLLIDVIVLILGLFMDVVPAVTLVAPIFLPIVTRLGVDPVVFGVTLVFGLVIGLLTPPVGSCLYIGCSIGKIDLLSLLKRVWPMVVAYVIVLMLMTMFPGIITFLPNLLVK